MEIDAVEVVRCRHCVKRDTEDCPMRFWDEYDDLISRVAVLRLLDENSVVFRGEIEKLPTVDAVPVTHAEWVYDPDGMDWNLGAWKCNKCHCRNDNLPGNLPKTDPYRWAGSKYCPNCGAKMGKTDV